ncbi:DUF4386 domain-containing protein [Sinisalibacter lacisalsi]|uniref:DUF4386 domain-containing protein n=1 Tax=Sinisalibacter lacisalsi TaxID=1526570 RepID=A0ABQ1QGG7_9RHOB|nr:DUF4386 domain-containing protein [Sinisalibacter lacisalsi]GGD25380.1 hypothetical protein GCM10011358_07300 [Sinisalibacter lacisalsi]
MNVFNDPQSRRYARLTGAFYVTIAIAGGFSILWVPSQLQVAGDAAATFANILANRGLYAAGIGGEVVILVAEIMATAMLYFMFKPVNATLSFAAALARLSMVGVMAAMLFFHAAAYALADPGSTLASLSEAQRFDLAGLMLAVHDAGVWVWQIFFTIHLAILGQLVARSGRYPRLLGHAMTLGSVGYLLDTLSATVLTGSAALATITGVFLAIVTLAEVGFALWLLIRGPRPATPAPAFA